MQSEGRAELNRASDLLSQADRPASFACSTITRAGPGFGRLMRSRSNVSHSAIITAERTPVGPVAASLIQNHSTYSIALNLGAEAVPLEGVPAGKVVFETPARARDTPVRRSPASVSINILIKQI